VFFAAVFLCDCRWYRCVGLAKKLLILDGYREDILADMSNVLVKMSNIFHAGQNFQDYEVKFEAFYLF